MNASRQYTDQRRVATRYPLAIPVELDRGSGRTRDVSTSGAYILLSLTYTPGEKVLLSMAMPFLAPGISRLRCRGHVVRIEPQAQDYGMAVHFDSLHLEDGGRAALLTDR